MTIIYMGAGAKGGLGGIGARPASGYDFEGFLASVAVFRAPRTGPRSRLTKQNPTRCEVLK